ncbi:MAG: hypothetical protein WBL63_08490 [Candidatus Acidiferrum sp.]
MKLARFILLAFFLAPFARADSGTVNMLFTGVNGVNDGQYYVSPYTGTMTTASGSQTVTLFCDDVLHEVGFNQSWTANVTNLGAAIAIGNFNNTRFGSTMTPDNATVLYEEVAWLTNQFNSSNQNQWVSLQHAIWDLTDPAAGYTDTGTWLTSAGALNPKNYGSVNASNFEIITNVGLNDPTQTQVQEFLVQTPEPGTLGLLFCGILALAAFTLLRTRAAA